MYVSHHWEGDDNGDDVYSACYTSWGNPNNIVNENSIVTVSSEYGGERWEPLNAINGIATGGRTCLGFSSAEQSDPYWQLDMVTPKTVKEVIIFSEYTIYIRDTVVYLGNSSSFQSNPIFGTAEEKDFTSMSLTPAAVSVGRYLTLVKYTSSGYLVFCEIQVIVE